MLSPDVTETAELSLVGVANLAVHHNQNLLLLTHPLGAGMGVAIYDPIARVGGLWHALLPDSSLDPQRAVAHPGLFLDTGLIELLKRAEAAGAKRENLRVCAAGGGRVLDESGCFNLGARNHQALAEQLQKRGLCLHAEDCGGLSNRTLQLNITTGEMRVKISGQAKTKLLCKP